MQVHLADVSWRKFATPQQPPEFDVLEARIAAQYKADQSSLSLKEYTLEYMKALPKEELDKLRKACDDMVTAQRVARTDDTDQYNYLRSRIPAGESMIGLFGLGHLDDSGGQRKGLNFWLEQEGARVTCVELYDNANTRDFIEAEYPLMGMVKRRQPDFTLMMDDADLQRGGKPAPGKPGGPTVH
jgi:hypothetical protein